METVTASLLWSDAEGDVLTLFVEPLSASWEARSRDQEIYLLDALDDNEEKVGRLAGIRIVGFLTFDRWEDLPNLPLRWHVEGYDPLPLAELLRHVQRALLQKTGRAVAAR
ncbi:MAG: hypothetical protein ACR2M3_01955 [Thermomicrobiales bacterium]